MEIVAVDMLQRESHRYADWLIPRTHWLEHPGLQPLLGNLMDRPFR